MNAQAGYNEEGIRSLVGVPVFGYTSSSTDTNFWNFIYNADKSNYIMGAQTSCFGSVNICNLQCSHAYTIISAFNLTLNFGIVQQVVMARNPWSTVNYNGSLSASDIIWKNPQILG